MISEETSDAIKKCLVYDQERLINRKLGYVYKTIQPYALS